MDLIELTELNEGFSDLMWQKGHAWEFVRGSSNTTSRTALNYEKKANAIQASVSSIPEIQLFARDKIDSFAASSESIMDYIEKML